MVKHEFGAGKSHTTLRRVSFEDYPLANKKNRLVKVAVREGERSMYFTLFSLLFIWSLLRLDPSVPREHNNAINKLLFFNSFIEQKYRMIVNFQIYVYLKWWNRNVYFQ